MTVEDSPEPALRGGLKHLPLDGVAQDDGIPRSPRSGAD